MSSSLNRPNGISEECILRISNLDCLSGGGTCRTLSNLPLLRSAGSIISGLFVAATTITPSIDSTPSMLDRI